MFITYLFSKLWEKAVTRIKEIFTDLLRDQYFVEGHIQTIPVFKGQKTPTPVKDAVLRATLRNQNLTDSIQAVFFEPNTFDANKCLRVAKRRYPVAIPVGTVKPIVPSFSLMKDFMDTNSPINKHKHPGNVEYYIESASVDFIRYNYILFSKQFAAPRHKPQVYNVRILKGGRTAVFYTRFYDGTNRDFKFVIRSPNLVLSNTDLYYYIVTHIQNADTKKIIPNTTQLTIVNANDPKYPNLRLNKDNAFTSFFPVIPIVLKNDLVAKKNTPAYAPIKDMVKSLGGMSIDSIHKGLLTNPHRKHLMATYLTAMIDLELAATQAELEYMFRFFNDIKDRAQYSMSDIRKWYDTSKSSAYAYMNTIILHSNNYLNIFSYYQITGKVLKGKHCKVGEYCRKINYASNISIFEVDPDFRMAQRPNTRQGIIIRKQISEEDYHEIIATGVMTTTYVPVLDRKINATLTSPGSNRIWIPIDMSILSKMNRAQRDLILFKASQFTFETYIRVKKKWYEKDSIVKIFSGVKIVASVLASVLEGINSLIKVLTGLDMKKIIGRIVKLAYELTVIPALVKLSRKYLGDETTYKIIAIVSVIAQIGAFIFAGGTAGATAAKVMGDMALQDVSRSMTQKLQDDEAELKKRREARTKQIEAHRKKYGLDNKHSNIFRILQHKALYPNESIHDFINRTIITDTIIEINMSMNMSTVERSLDPEFYMMKTNMMRYSNQIMNNIS